MSPTYDVLVIGSYSIDLIFSGMAEFPRLGSDTISTDFKMTPGEAYITAVSLHRLGVRVCWAADFGNDEFSQLALHFAREEGLDETLFVFHDRPYRRISVAATYPHERAFLTYYDPDPLIPPALAALIKSKARVVYIPGLYYGSYLDSGSKLANAKKMEMFMDGNSSSGEIIGRSRQCAAIRKALKNIDVFLPNAQEAMRLTREKDIGEAIRKLSLFCPLVVVKAGPDGSYAYANDTLIHVPAIPVNPVDTTGAGDNFNAGFLRAWLDHQPLATCLQWGNIVGGLSTTELGGTTRKVTIDEVRTILSRVYPSSRVDTGHLQSQN